MTTTRVAVPRRRVRHRRRRHRVGVGRRRRLSGRGHGLMQLLQLVAELTQMLLVVGFAQYAHAEQVVPIADAEPATSMTYTNDTSLLLPVAPGRGARLCTSSARISQKPHVQTTLNFLHMLPMAVTRSSDGSAICALPVLWMASCFHTIGHMRRTARLTAEGCQSAGGNADRVGASVLQLKGYQSVRNNAESALPPAD